jgi:hypothetical protein
VEYVRTGMSKEDTVMRVMFDTIRNDTIILHDVAVRLGLRARGGPLWLTIGARTPGTAAESMWCQSWTGRAAGSGSEPGRELPNAIGAEG